jgi:hypothetical protein
MRSDDMVNHQNPENESVHFSLRFSEQDVWVKRY